MPSVIGYCLLAPVLYFGVQFVRKLVIPGPFDHIAGPKPASRILGNLPQFFDRQGWQFQRELGENYGRVVKLSMPFGAKWLFVFDPKALHEIVIKHQDVYEETPIFQTGNRLILGEGLLATIGDHHRQQRKMLNPSFSPGHLKEMLPIMLEIVDKLHQALSQELTIESSRELDVLDWTTRTALEIVGQCALGYSFDPLVEQTINPCGAAFKALEPTIFPMHILRVLLPFIVKVGSPQFRRRILEWTPYPRLQKVREIVDTLEYTAKEILTAKRAALERGDEELAKMTAEGKDVMSVLLKANMAASAEERIPDVELLGHMSTFIFAGMNTTSHTTSHILHLVSQHQDVQNRLRDEITKTQARLQQENSKLTYETLLELPYLDAVCKETLRIFPAVSFIGRRTQEPITMHLSTTVTGVDGTPVDSIFVPVQSTVIIGIAASNTDKAIWGDDAHEWKPDRWLGGIPYRTDDDTKVPGVYNGMMTFLGGGRACIGYRFAELEMKAILYTLLPSFRFDVPLDKEICWNLAGIQYPTVGTTNTKVEMPLRITLVSTDRSL